jgi:hypothetical protein
MKVCETIQQSLQHVKTSLGTAAQKTSATVKKASQIALKILKVLFTPITYLCTRAKSFFEKRREQPTGSQPDAASASGEILAEAAYQQVLTNLIEGETDPSRRRFLELQLNQLQALTSLIEGETDPSRRSFLELQLNQLNGRVRRKISLSNMTEQVRVAYEKRMREGARP